MLNNKETSELKRRRVIMNRMRMFLIAMSGLFLTIGMITVFLFQTQLKEKETDIPTFYQDVVEIENPASFRALVNKNYRLPADYEPSDLVLLDVPLYNKDKNNEANYLRKEAARALKNLFEAAYNEKGYELIARSGYRSYDTQVMLYDRYVKEDGVEAADTYSARPGHSEHQTGLTIDITSDSVHGGLTETFGETDEGKWVAENAHRFGFIIRYPENRVDETGYQYEPWHLRYVGTEAATSIYNDQLILEDYVLNVMKQIMLRFFKASPFPKMIFLLYAI